MDDSIFRFYLSPRLPACGVLCSVIHPVRSDDWPNTVNAEQSERAERRGTRKGLTEFDAGKGETTKTTAKQFKIYLIRDKRN